MAGRRGVYFWVFVTPKLPPPPDPLHSPTAAMLKVAKRAKAPKGSSAFIRKAYREGAMLREYWSKPK